VTPYYQDQHCTIYHGDALDVLPEIGEEVQTIVADPPYCSGGRTQASARATFEKNDNKRRQRTGKAWFLTDNMGTDSYVWWLRELAGRCFDVAQVGAHAYVFTDWRQYTNVVTAWETKGWTLRSVVVWDKARGGAMGSFWRSNHEWIPVFTKGPPRPLPRADFFNVWSGVKPQDGDHPTVKPLALIQHLIDAGGGGLVLDPTMGSGTTLRAAKNLGARCIGVDLEEDYCKLAVDRLRQEALPLCG
jgi:DNA modification methylase